MMPKTPGDRNPLSGGGETADAKTVAAAKEALALFAQTVSHMKLYPASHSSVANFRNQFFARLSKFLDENDELEIDIQQNAFLYGGEVIYLDENVLRSLPYLFFKDGMKKLAFLRGLDLEELEVFLTVVREISFLPIDVGDIVDALWQKDLARIRYDAPDDYLESKVTVQQRIPSQFQVRPEELFRGRIELKPEDIAEMFARRQSRTQSAAREDADYASRFAALDEEEARKLQAVLSAQRQIAPDKDFLDMILELLHIEERPEVLIGILTFLQKYHKYQLQALDFVHAAQLQTQIDQIARAVAGKAPEKERALEDFRTVQRESFPEKDLLKAMCEKRVDDPAAFFAYLAQVGPTAFPLGAELVRHGPSEDVRVLALRYLEDMGRINPRALAALAHDDKPDFTRIVVTVFGKIRDPQTIPFLANVLSFQNKASRLRAIQALGQFPDEQAHKILTTLLRDPDEDIRTQAAAVVRIAGDTAAIAELMHLAARKKFQRKTPAEKTAFLKVLGRSRSEEACTLLAKILQTSALIGRQRVWETRLGAVAGLEANGGPAAIEALRTAARRAPRKIGAASRDALQRLKAGRPDPPGKTP
jgi:DNA-directed RNA polymerase subunit F